MTQTELEIEATEHLLVEAYRKGKIGHFDLSRALGIDRFQTDALLKRHNVTEDLPTLEEVDEELAALKKLVDG